MSTGKRTRTDRTPASRRFAPAQQAATGRTDHKTKRSNIGQSTAQRRYHRCYAKGGVVTPTAESKTPAMCWSPNSLDHSSMLSKSSTVAEMGDRLATVDMERKVGGCCAPFRGGAGSPSNTISPGPRPTSVPSGILIHPTIWPSYDNVTDRQDRQTDRITVP